VPKSVLHRRDCSYLWSHHVPIAQRAGLTASEIDAIRDGEVTNDQDRVVARAVDELDERSTISIRRGPSSVGTSTSGSAWI
jgi:4-carboxymuconolactone decarboxylase